MELDLQSPVPIFRQIVDRLCAAIAAGIYRPGDLVPSVRQQAVKLLVNPNTVQRAYEQLERDGLLLSRRGSGMEVAPQAPAAAMARSAENVRGIFSNGIEAGKSACLSRQDVDSLYHKAWNDESDVAGGAK